MAARRQWRWKDDPETVADETPFGILFELRDGLVYRWRQNFASIIEAMRRSEYAGRMAEAPSTEAVSSRIAEIREQLTLLADYL